MSVRSSVKSRFIEHGCSVRKSKTSGRYVMSETAKKTGSVILSEMPLVFSLSVKSIEQNCQYCLKSFAENSSSSKRCSKCKIARYCSSECQKQHWSFHKFECACLPLVLREFLRVTNSEGFDYLLLFRTILALQFDVLDSAQKEEYFSLIGFELGSNKLPSYVLLQFTEISTFMFDLFKKIKPSNVGGKQFNYPKIADVQAFVARQELNVRSLRGCANALFGGLSMFNHSCCPNATVSVDDVSITVRTSQPVEVAEEVYICYTDIIDPYKRALKLRSKGFKCDCQRCTSKTRRMKDFGYLCGMKCLDDVCDGLLVARDWDSPERSTPIMVGNAPQLKDIDSSEDLEEPLKLICTNCKAESVIPPEMRRGVKENLQQCRELEEDVRVLRNEGKSQFALEKCQSFLKWVEPLFHENTLLVQTACRGAFECSRDLCSHKAAFEYGCRVLRNSLKFITDDMDDFTTLATFVCMSGKKGNVETEFLLPVVEDALKVVSAVKGPEHWTSLTLKLTKHSLATEAKTSGGKKT